MRKLGFAAAPANGLLQHRQPIKLGQIQNITPLTAVARRSQFLQTLRSTERIQR